MACSICKSPSATFYHAKRDYLQLSTKICNECKAEYSICFCGAACENTIKGSNERLNYEYLICNECSYIGVRCTRCNKLCDIEISKDTSKHPYSLYWCCRTCDVENRFKGFVEDSLRKYVNKYREIACINEEILCNFIFYYVDIFSFKYICKMLSFKQSLDYDEMIALLKAKHPDNENIIKIINECQIKNEGYSTPRNRISRSVSVTPNNRPRDDLPTETDSFRRFFEIDWDRMNEEKFNEMERKLDIFIKNFKERLDHTDKSVKELTDFKDSSNDNIANLQATFQTYKNSTDENFNKIGNRINAMEMELAKSFEQIQISNQVQYCMQNINY